MTHRFFSKMYLKHYLLIQIAKFNSRVLQLVKWGWTNNSLMKMITNYLLFSKIFLILSFEFS